jgi:hypothetical protein
VTAATVHRRPAPQLPSVQQVSAHVPDSQRPLRQASAPEQLSPIAFVPTDAMPKSPDATQYRAPVPAAAHTAPAMQSADVQHDFVQKRPRSTHAAGTMPATAHAPDAHTASAKQGAPSATVPFATHRFNAGSQVEGDGQFAAVHV